MTLDLIKAIAAARTKREWHYTEFDTVEIGITENAIFIAMAANNFDKLLAIAEAAKAYAECDWENNIELSNELCDAAATLESDK